MRVLRTIVVTLAALAALSACASAAPLVAIDPGHGGADGGAKGPLPPGTQTGLPPRVDPDGTTWIYEKDVNLDVANRLNAALVARGYPTVMTRTQDLAGGDVPYTTESADLQARVAIANAAGAQLFVSLHQNALGPTTSGTETYHFSFSSEASRALATLVHGELVAALGLPDRGVRTAGFYVLKNTAMPAILIEGAFLSNPSEALLLADSGVRQRIADAVAAGIVRYVEAGGGTVYAPPAVPQVPRYQVNAGTFRRLRDATSRYRFVRRKGFDAVVRRELHPKFRKYVFVVVGGKFVNLSNARNLRDRMRATRIRANVTAIPKRSVPVRVR